MILKPPTGFKPNQSGYYQEQPHVRKITDIATVTWKKSSSLSFRLLAIP